MALDRSEDYKFVASHCDYWVTQYRHSETRAEKIATASIAVVAALIAGLAANTTPLRQAAWEGWIAFGGCVFLFGLACLVISALCAIFSLLPVSTKLGKPSVEGLQNMVFKERAALQRVEICSAEDLPDLLFKESEALSMPPFDPSDDQSSYWLRLQSHTLLKFKMYVGQRGVHTTRAIYFFMSGVLFISVGSLVVLGNWVV